jgi:hypothetical protein
MIIGRMVSLLDATIFDQEGYSSHKPPKGSPDGVLGWRLSKKGGGTLDFSFFFFSPPPRRWGDAIACWNWPKQGEFCR